MSSASILHCTLYIEIVTFELETCCENFLASYTFPFCRMKNELNRPSFEFEIDEWLDDSYDFDNKNDTLEFAHRDLLLWNNVIDGLYQLGC